MSSNHFFPAYDRKPPLRVDMQRKRETAICQLEGCTNPLPANRPANQKYCSLTCKFENNRRRTEKWRAKKGGGK